MDTIIEKYYLELGSTLAYYQHGPNGVDCWFDADNIRQHRCLSFVDFDLIHPVVETIVLNPEEALQSEYEENWKDLVTFESFLSIKAQQSVFESNEKGYQVNSTRH